MKSWLATFNQTDTNKDADNLKHDDSFSRPSPLQSKNASLMNNLSIPATPDTHCLVSTKEFEDFWVPKLKTPTILEYNLLHSELLRTNSLFTLEQTALLVKALFQYKKVFEIHQIYKKNHNRLLNELDTSTQLEENSTTKMQILNVLMETEYLLTNYHNFEELFAILLKYRYPIKSQTIEMAFLSFINTSNFSMCKDFFQQVMSNTEQYQLNEKHFINIVKKLSLSGELELLRVFIETWVANTYNNDHSLISKNLLRFIHSTTLEHEKNSYLSCSNMTSIKKLSSMLKREYLKSVDAKSIKFYETLKRIQPKDIASLAQFQLSFETFLEELQKKHASTVPVILLTVLSVASRNKQEGIFDWTLSNCIKNKQFFTYLDYVQLEQIITERLFLKHDLLGLITFIENARHMKLSIKSFKTLNETFLSRFPFLEKAVYPEYRILFSDPKFQEKYPWCNIFLCKHHLEHSVDVIVKRKLTRQDASDDSKKENFFFDDLSTADKMKSSYTILKRYVNYRRGMKHIDETQIDKVIEFVRRVFEEGHFRYQNQLPLKFQMLQIEIEALRSFHKMSRLEKKILRKTVYKERIDNFVSSKSLLLRSDDYLRLANLVSKRPFKDFDYGKMFLNKSLENISTHTNNNAFELAKNWYKFYMTSLKISVQSHDITFFVEIVKDWNANKDAFYILPECVTDLKGFQKYWIKRKEFLMTSTQENSNFSDNLHVYDDFLADIDINVGQLKQRYVDYEYEGLNTMQKLVQSIKNRFEREVKAKNP